MHWRYRSGESPHLRRAQTTDEVVSVGSALAPNALHSCVQRNACCCHFGGFPLPCMRDRRATCGSSRAVVTASIGPCHQRFPVARGDTPSIQPIGEGGPSELCTRARCALSSCFLPQGHANNKAWQQRSPPPKDVVGRVDGLREVGDVGFDEPLDVHDLDLVPRHVERVVVRPPVTQKRVVITTRHASQGVS